MSQRAVLWCCFGLTVVGCSPGPADSSDPQFAAVLDRVEWLEDRISGELPSPVIDVHFVEVRWKPKRSHMGPTTTSYWLRARVEIDPNDAAAWAARTEAVAPPPFWQPDSSPMQHPTAKWAMPPADFAGATWHDPTPLFSRSAHRGYQAGYMIINEPGDAVYVWQHWR